MSSTDSDTLGKVVGMLSEQVVDMIRNGWTASIGIGGRHGPDYAVMSDRLGGDNYATVSNEPRSLLKRSTSLTTPKIR